MSTIHVNLGPRSYDIRIGTDLKDSLQPWFSNRTGPLRALIVTDENIYVHAQTLQTALGRSFGVASSLRTLPPGEDQKCQATLSKLYDALVDINADRQTLVIAVGGGVIGDLAGYVAHTFNRGLPLFMVPTTLLAMVDSSVGGKVGINHPHAKNLIGAFHQPRGVIIHLPFLDTLPDREFHSGLAEVVKYGMIMDQEFFHWLRTTTDWRNPDVLSHIIATSCTHKATVVQEDEYETTGHRAILNFGHTFAHAIEAVAGYGTLLHGEAVAIGMVAATRLAHQIGFSANLNADESLIPLLRRMKLPTELDPSWPADALLAAMRHDKKNVSGQLRFVLPRWIGKVESGVPVEEAEVRTILAGSLRGAAHAQ